MPCLLQKLRAHLQSYNLILTGIPKQKKGVLLTSLVREDLMDLMVGKMALGAGSATEEGTEAPQFIESRQKYSPQ